MPETTIPHATGWVLRALAASILGCIPNVLRCEAGRLVYCFCTIDSELLRDCTFVPVIESTDDPYLEELCFDGENQGYQRPGSRSRMNSFANYLQQHPDSVVPPVLLSARGHWKFLPSCPDSNFGELEMNDRAAIIDGQHRVGGYVALLRKFGKHAQVPIIVIENFTYEEEKEEFLVVNNCQKGVPKALTQFLKGGDDTAVAWLLNEDFDSPFAGRISRTTVGKEHLFALHSVAKEMKRLFSLSLDSLDTETRAEYASKFFDIVADAFPDEWSDMEQFDMPGGGGKNAFQYKILELTGLIAWCTVGYSIFQRSFSPETGMDWDNVKRLVLQCQGFDWSKSGQYAGRTGLAGGAVIAKDLLRKLPPEGKPQQLPLDLE